MAVPRGQDMGQKVECVTVTCALRPSRTKIILPVRKINEISMLFAPNLAARANPQNASGMTFGSPSRGAVLLGCLYIAGIRAVATGSLSSAFSGVFTPPGLVPASRDRLQPPSLRGRTFFPARRCHLRSLVATATVDDSAEMRKNPALYSAMADKKQKTDMYMPAEKPEVLAPVGGWAQLHAAVNNGADAVYFGVNAFNARKRASGFDPETELPEVMGFLHQHGVKGFVTLNVLVFDSELKDLEILVRALADAGVDAVIVQDVGAVKLIREVAPNLKIHGSTQMSITSAEGAKFASELGVQRVVLGRELSVKEIAKVKEEYDEEIEVFVHGALCVSYSGQCFSSEAWGGRSANRGQCAQACRLPYSLVLNGEEQPMEDIKYLLSPQDLMAVDIVPELIRAGVSTFKIEGRLKGPEYVAVVTRVYREAVDRAWEAMKGDAALPKMPREALGLTKEVDLQLRQVFARGQDSEHGGLTHGFLDGPQHQSLVRGRNPRHRGVYLGRVVGVSKQGVQVDLSSPIKRGDGVVFDQGAPEEAEEGGSVFEVMDRRGRSVAKNAAEEVASGVVTLTFGKGAVKLHRVHEGDLVWKNRDMALDKKLEQLVKGGEGGSDERDGVVVAVTGKLGERLQVEARDTQGRVGKGSSTSELEEATGKGLGREALAKAVGKLGDTGLRLLDLDLDNLDSGLFVPGSEVKEARRQAMADILAERMKPSGAGEGVRREPVLEGLLTGKHEGEQGEGEGESAKEDGGVIGSADVVVLCRTKAQAQAAASVPWLKEIILDFLEVHGLVEAVAMVRDAGKAVTVATPRILKPDEHNMYRFYLKLGADALLVRSAGMLQRLVDLGGAGAAVPEVKGAVIPKLFGDFSLNAANQVAARELLGEHAGLERLCPTHDLNAEQLCRLGEGLGAALQPRLEAIAHQHLPIFHTEHCVFCRFLSDGNSYKDCGHPCETNQVHLQDEHGGQHLVLADMGCRNTVFNAKAQSAAFYLRSLQRAGYSTFRIELVDEPADQVVPLLEGYKGVVDGSVHPSELWGLLNRTPNANEQAQGVHEGSLSFTGDPHLQTLKATAAQIDPKWKKMKGVRTKDGSK